jgi:hypothetical protein
MEEVLSGWLFNVCIVGDATFGIVNEMVKDVKELIFGEWVPFRN